MLSRFSIILILRVYTARILPRSDDNDDNADDGDFDDTLGEIFGASFMATTSLDLDFASGAVDSNVDLARTHLLSTLALTFSLYTHLLYRE